jgi:hypothetical protein
MEDSTLGQRGVHHRALHAPPVLGVALADDNNVERHSERTQRSVEPYHLGVPVGGVALYDKDVEITIRACVIPPTGAEKHDLDGIGSYGRQRPTRSLDDVLGDHGDTVAKPTAEPPSRVPSPRFMLA